MSVMKPASETSTFVILTGTAGLLFVTMMLRVIGSLPAVKLPKLTMSGVTCRRARTMPATGISTCGCCDTLVLMRTGAFKRPSGASPVTVSFNRYCSPARPGILSFSPAGAISAFT